jgi:adenylate cyclase
MAARCYAARQALGSVVDAEWEKAEIRRLASRVSAIGRDDALALCWAGYAMVYVCREYEVGAALTDQALAINPNLAAGWTNRGVISSFLGQYETAIRQLTEALRLNPKDPESFRPESFIAVAHFILGRYDQALVWAARSQASQATWMPALRVSAVANALGGNLDEARKLVARMLRQDPGMRISNLGKYLAYRDTDAIGLFARGLRMAGMPE